MKKRIGLLLIMVLLGTLLMSGCQGKKDEKMLTWGIAGVWGYDSDESISKEQEDILNQMLKEKGKDYQIHFRVFSFDGKMLSEEDEEALQKCDLITMANQFSYSNNVEFYPTLVDYVKREMFEPLDSYMQMESGKAIKEAMLIEESMVSGRVGNQQWFLPTRLPALTGNTIMIQKAFYENSGLAVDVATDFTECDELFAQIYELNGEQPFLTLSDRKVEFGLNGVPGVLPEYMSEILAENRAEFMEQAAGVGSLRSQGSDTDTRNLLKTEFVKKAMNAWKRYMDKGYVNPNMDTEPLVKMGISYEPGVVYFNTGKEDYAVLRARNYMMSVEKQPASANPFVGIGAKSGNKERAFQALADMITDVELQEIIQGINADSTELLVFGTGLTKEETALYCEEAAKAVRCIQESITNSFDIPEIKAVNEVFAEYTSEPGSNPVKNVLDVYFSRNGEVTEESISEALDAWNRKLDNAGIEKIVNEIQKQKEQNRVDL